jgi:hypothetical protein
MSRARIVQRLKPDIDPIDMWFGLLPNLAGYAAFVTWADFIVRAIRGERPKEGWRLFASTGAFIAIRTLLSGTHVREAAALRGAAVEMRGLVHDAAEAARLREQRAEERDRRE